MLKEGFGLSAMTSMAYSYKPAPKKVIIPCTCGRKNRDLDECAILREEDGKVFYGWKSGPKESEASTVVCLRQGCLGKWRSRAKALEKLPRLWFSDYQKLKSLV